MNHPVVKSIKGDGEFSDYDAQSTFKSFLTEMILPIRETHLLKNNSENRTFPNRAELDTLNRLQDMLKACEREYKLLQDPTKLHLGFQLDELVLALANEKQLIRKNYHGGRNSVYGLLIDSIWELVSIIDALECEKLALLKFILKEVISNDDADLNDDSLRKLIERHLADKH